MQDAIVSNVVACTLELGGAKTTIPLMLSDSVSGLGEDVHSALVRMTKSMSIEKPENSKIVIPFKPDILRRLSGIKKNAKQARYELRKLARKLSNLKV